MKSKDQAFITIVSGLPRSGTSMMMRMLEAGGMPILTDNIRAADDDNPNGYYEFEPVKQLVQDTSWLVDASGKVVKIVYRLLHFLPNDYRYRVIFMERKIEEILASQRVMLRRRGEEKSTADDTSLAKLFQHELQQTKGWLRNQENFNVTYIHYSDVQDDPGNAARAVNRFLGFGLNTQAMVKVVDSLLYRQRR